MQNSTDKQNPLQLKSFDGESQKKSSSRSFILEVKPFLQNRSQYEMFE